MTLSVSLILVIATCAVSIPAFSNGKLMNDLIFYPPAITNQKQYYRFFTHGFLHADVAHLAFNMIALYSFGEAVEQIYSLDCLFGRLGKLYYQLMYAGALLIASVPTYVKNKDNYHYRSLGASGAVSAVVFAGITLLPQLPINIMFIPIDIPGYIFGVAYLAISAWLDKKGGGHINHSAHFWGAAFGVLFTVVMCLALAKLDVVDNFMRQIQAGTGKILPFQCDL
jgi:membrane associated rhomboid family serine protease